MVKRIFWNTFIISMAVMLLLVAVLAVASYIIVGDKLPREDIANLVTAVLGAIVILVAFAYICAKKSAKAIVEPLGKINLEGEKIANSTGYEELKPLFSRIRRQNVMIDTNMRDIKREYAKRENFRRDFTANVSHELRTPLTSISGISEMLMNGIINQEDVPEFAENINKEASRLINLVNDIILISRLEGDEVAMQKESVNISEIALSVMKRLELIAERKNISLKVVADEEIYVLGVPSMLEEMIFNLTDNAIKYNVEGGEVKLIIEEEEKKVKIIVEDTGIGIPDEDKNSIFERFYRVDKSRSKEVGGTGLGLSIVKHIAIYHNGKVKAYNREGGGTRMIATIRK